MRVPTRTRHEQCRRLDYKVGELGHSRVDEIVKDGATFFRYRITCRTCLVQGGRHYWSTRWRVSDSQGWGWDEVLDCWHEHLVARHLDWIAATNYALQDTP